MYYSATNAFPAAPTRTFFSTFGAGSGLHPGQRHRLCRGRARGGVAVDDFAAQLSFFFNAHNNLLEEVAKYRVARRLWARTMRERFDARDPRSLMLRFHAQTAGSSLTAQLPDNNVVRVTIQALAAVLGGCQSLHTNSLDEALSLPTERAVRIALRTQQVIAYEAGVADTADPHGGSYGVELLTRPIEEEAEAYIAKTDGLGGAVAAIGFSVISRSRPPFRTAIPGAASRTHFPWEYRAPF